MEELKLRLDSHSHLTPSLRLKSLCVRRGGKRKKKGEGARGSKLGKAEAEAFTSVGRVGTGPYRL